MKKKLPVLLAICLCFLMGCNMDRTQETPVPTNVPSQTVVPTNEPSTEPTATVAPTPTIEPTVAPTAISTPSPTPTEIPHEHIWKEIERPATCTEDGKTCDACDCGEIQNEIIVPATGHLEYTYQVVTNPSLEADGVYENI